MVIRKCDHSYQLSIQLFCGDKLERWAAEWCWVCVGASNRLLVFRRIKATSVFKVMRLHKCWNSILIQGHDLESCGNHLYCTSVRMGTWTDFDSWSNIATVQFFFFHNFCFKMHKIFLCFMFLKPFLTVEKWKRKTTASLLLIQALITDEMVPFPFVG